MHQFQRINTADTPLGYAACIWVEEFLPNVSKVVKAVKRNDVNLKKYQIKY